MRVIDWKRSATGFRSNSPGVQISATSAKFRITACSRSSMSSLTRSSRNVTGPPRRARSIRARNNARSNRMGAAVGFEAMPVGTPPAPSLAILRLSTMPAALASSHGRRGITTTLHLQPSAWRARRLPRRVRASSAARARHRAADAVRFLPRAGRWRGRLRGVLGEIVVHRAAVLSAARHSLCLRSRSGIAVDGGDRQPTGLPARPRRGAL